MALGVWRVMLGISRGGVECGGSTSGTCNVCYTYPNTNTFVQSKKYRVQIMNNLKIHETGNWKNKFCFIHPDYMPHATCHVFMYVTPIPVHET